MQVRITKMLALGEESQCHDDQEPITLVVCTGTEVVKTDMVAANKEAHELQDHVLHYILCETLLSQLDLYCQVGCQKVALHTTVQQCLHNNSSLCTDRRFTTGPPTVCLHVRRLTCYWPSAAAGSACFLYTLTTPVSSSSRSFVSSKLYRLAGML